MLLVLLCLALAGAERGGHWLRSRFLLPTRGAQWIWVEHAALAAHPVAVWAVRDFDVGARPPESTRLLVAADEEYLVYVNGRLVGAGAYAAEAALDELVLDEEMKAGWNRIVVELRSVRGAGGFLASLFVDREASAPSREPLVRSDGSWRIFRRRLDGLLEGWLPLDGGEAAVVWGAPPTGRWPAREKTEVVPSFAGRLAAIRDPVRIETLHRPCSPPCGRGDSEGGAELPDSAFLVDFGETGVGFLELGLEAAPGFAYEVRLGESLRQLVGGSATVLQAVPLPERKLWLASRAARFRYALVLGIDRLEGARILEVAQRRQAWELARGGEVEGLFGIEPRPR